MRFPTWSPVALFALFSAATLSSAFGADQPEADPSPQDQSQDQARDQAQFTPETLYLVLMGDIAAQRGQYREAAKSYLEAAKITGDARLARSATEIALYAKDAGLGLSAVRLWVGLEPDSARARQFFAALLVNQNELAEAKSYIAKMFADEAGDEQRTAANLMQLDHLVGSHNDKTGVFDLVQDLVQPYSKYPEAHYAAAKAGLDTGLSDHQITEKSLEEIDRALALRPGWEQAEILKSQLLGKTAPDQAVSLLRKFLSSHPDSKTVRSALANLLVDQKRYAEARDELTILAKNDPQPDLQEALARVAMLMNDYDFAEKVLQKLLATGTGDQDEIRLYLGEISEELKRYPEAIERYRAVEDGDQWWSAQLRIAYAMAKSGKLDEARAFLHALEPEDEEQRVQVIQTEAQLLRDAEQYNAAYDLLDGGLAKYPDSRDLLYDLAMAAEKVDKLEIVETKLKQLIELEPQNAQAYNALGYTLVDRTARSEEGLHYIEKAYSLSPEDPFILDSMGWALYRTGKAAQSVDYLRRALAQRPDAEIAAHLGEVLWTVGDQAEAKRVWRSQLQETPDNAVLIKTMQRFVP